MADEPLVLLRRHVAALVAGDLDSLLEDYAPDAVVLLPEDVYEGRTAIRQLFEDLLSALPQPSFEAISTSWSDDALLLQWTADSRNHRVPDGVDTFVFRDGRIALQTISCTLVPHT